MCLEPPDMCTPLGCLLGYSALDLGELTFINSQHGKTVSQTLGDLYKRSKQHNPLRGSLLQDKK